MRIELPKEALDMLQKGMTVTIPQMLDLEVSDEFISFPKMVWVEIRFLDRELDKKKSE